MEFYGSIFNISGSVTASAFTGSYIGDGAGLYNLPASGVTGLNLSQISSGSAVASITPTGFTVNTNTTITGSLIVTGTVVSQTSTLVSGSSQIEITGTTGYSTFSSSLATTDLNQENRLTALETSSGSLNGFTSSINTTIKSKLNADGVISGSAQILNSSNLVSSSAQVTAYGFATTGSNLFNGTQTHSGSILPSVDNAYDLGSANYQWRDVYISSGSLYIDGTKVISSTAQELIITTDNGQSIKILEGTTDSIILQTADGDIELKSSADGDILLDPTNGKIMLKGPVEILSGQKIQSSVGGTPVVFANDIVVSGSIDITGTIEGINLTDFSSSVNTRIGNLESAAGSLNSFTSSANSRLIAIESSTGSLNTFTSSINTTIKSKLDSDGVISGSSQIILTGTTGYSTFSSSVSTSIGDISGSVATTTSGLSSSIGSLSSSVAITTSGLTSTITSLSSSVSSSIGSLSSSVATTTSGLSSTITSLSSSVATTTSGLGTSITNLSSSIATTTLNQSGRLDSIEGKTGSYATTGSNIFQGNQTITGSLYVSQDLIIAGSSSIQHISSSVVNIADNIITVNAQNPSIRFGGLAVIDSGSSPQVSGSMLFDSTNDQWIFVHQNQTTVTSSILLMGPQTYDNLGNETYPTTNRVLKSVNAEHIGDSNISDTGTKVSVNSNTEITGSLIVTGDKLTVNAIGGDEGGEILLGKPTTNTTLVGQGVTIDVWQNRLRFFEQGGNARGGYFDISSLGNGASTNLLGTAATASYVEYSNVANKPALVSGSSQITFSSISSIPSGLVSGSSQVLSGTGIWSSSAQLPSGVVSGSSQVLSGTGIWSSSAQLPSGVVSGSSQISFGSITGVPSGLVSGSSQVLAGTTIHSGSFFNGITVVSGSAQISFNGITDKPTLVSGSSQISFGSITGVPGGLVSGSSQIDLTSTTNYSSGIKTRLSAEGVLSGSAQVNFGSITGVPSGLVSGSSQISFGSITGVPGGLVSGSSQISFGSITGVPSGLVSGSSQVLAGTTIHSGSFFNGITVVSGSAQISFSGISGVPSGLVSGSSQISFGSISGVPSGLVSGSSQITLSSTTGFGSYLNQGVLTSSSPSFAGLTTTGLVTMSRSAGATGLDMATNDNYASMRVIANQVTSGGNADGMYIGYQNGNSGVTRIFGGGATSGGIAVNGSGVNNVTIAGNIVLNASNYTSYAMQGAGYSANQNLNTTSSPTFDSPYFSGAVSHNTSSSRNKYNVYGSSGTYCIGMQSGIGYGGLSDWGMTFQFNNDNVRGFWWGDDGHSVNQGAMALTTHGYLTLARGARIGYGESDTTTPTLPLQVYGSGGVVVDIQGASGQLFSVTDDLTGDIFSVSDISGMPLLNVNATTGTGFGFTAFPLVNNLYDLGTSALRWANVYTNDLHLSNEGKNGGNDIDGTTGNWTIQEGAEQLYIINNKNGKKFRINLTEIE
jgi:hypothetical protein